MLESLPERWQHQKEAIRICRDRDYFGLFFDMGTGKTRTAIDIFRHWSAQQEKLLMFLILCPVGVVPNWGVEFKKYANEITWSKVACLTRTGAAKKKQLEKALNGEKKIFVTSIDTVNTALWPSIIKLPWDGIILDESHRFKGPEAERTKKMIAGADKIKKKLLLTGTFVLNGPMDVWAQLRIMCKDLLPDNYYYFRAEYFWDKNRGMPPEKYFPDWQPKPDTFERLQKIIAANSMRVEIDDVLDLPDLVTQNVYVDLTPEQRKHYDEMEEEFITFVNGSAVVAELALTKLLRLQQIVAGIFKDENGITHRIPTAKKKALKEILQDLNPKHKAVVWSNFIDTYDDVIDVFNELDLPYAKIIGGQSSTIRQKEIEKFKTDSKIRMMLANQGAGGTGIDGLQVANHAIYYNKNFNSEHDQQSGGRTRRGGSEIHEKIVRIDIIAKDTTDEEVTASLRQKKSVGEFLLGFKKDRKKDRIDNALLGAI